jgi:lipopolysaccharide transport system ATP-binding protein
MSHPVINVSGLGKTYRLGGSGPDYRTLREELARWFGRAPDPRHTGGGGSFDALDNVSFAVQAGEVMGVIGRNGAGKSTLLKILSRITMPTRGEADIYGRLGSLLEIGTGFHPELSGRENIYFSGALLGMKRADIRRRFDDIVAFAEVERFIDTPCKHYSSGMYARLGFAVAAHLDTDILLVDEVLAVGDTGFQQKCLGKMSEVAGGGRTVLFVSHNMAAVRQLCTRGLVLERGRVAYCGEIGGAVAAYQAQFAAAGVGAYARTQPGTGPAWIASARLGARDGRPMGCVAMSDPLELELEVESTGPRRFALSLQVREDGQSPLLHVPSVDAGQVIPVEAGRHRLRLTVPPVMLYPGVYGLRLTLTEAGAGGFDVLDQVDDLNLTVEQDPGVCTRPLLRSAGVVFVRPQWEYLGRA